MAQFKIRSNKDLTVDVNKAFKKYLSSYLKEFNKKLNKEVLQKYGFSVGTLMTFKKRKRYYASFTNVTVAWKITKVPENVYIANTDIVSAGVLNWQKTTAKKSLITKLGDHEEVFVVRLRKAIYMMADNFMAKLSTELSVDNDDDISGDGDIHKFETNIKVRFSKKEFNVNSNGQKLSKYNEY